MRDEILRVLKGSPENVGMTPYSIWFYMEKDQPSHCSMLMPDIAQLLREGRITRMKSLSGHRDYFWVSDD